MLNFCLVKYRKEVKWMMTKKGGLVQSNQSRLLTLHPVQWFQKMEESLFKGDLRPNFSVLTRQGKKTLFLLSRFSPEFWWFADHNPRAGWREGKKAEDMMRAAFDMQVWRYAGRIASPLNWNSCELSIRQRSQTLSIRWRCQGSPTLPLLHYTGLMCPRPPHIFAQELI